MPINQWFLNEKMARFHSSKPRPANKSFKISRFFSLRRVTTTKSYTRRCNKQMLRYRVRTFVIIKSDRVNETENWFKQRVDKSKRYAIHFIFIWCRYANKIFNIDAQLRQKAILNGEKMERKKSRKRQPRNVYITFLDTVMSNECQEKLNIICACMISSGEHSCSVMVIPSRI